MYCKKCPGNPQLVYSTKDQPANFIAPTEKNICKACGYNFGKINANTKKVLWGCKTCQEYYICSNCKLCREGHALFKCYSLRKKSQGGLYASNQFNCDVCDTVQKIPEGGYVWHCNPCQFDACHKHYDIVEVPMKALLSKLLSENALAAKAQENQQNSKNANPGEEAKGIQSLTISSSSVKLLPKPQGFMGLLKLNMTGPSSSWKVVQDPGQGLTEMGGDDFFEEDLPNLYPL